MTPQAYVFLGRSGSGKGTQANLIIDLLKKSDPGRGVLHIETGREFRKIAKGESHTARLTAKIMEAGALMPEFMCVYAWGNFLVDNYTGNEHLVFDGTPRKIMEAKIFDSIFSFYKFDKPWMIYLDVEDEESTKRLLLRKRLDDSEAAIKRRLKWFDDEVRPTVEHYRTNPNVRFIEIDGERSIEEIHAEIVKLAVLT